jgi:hypothetical protein
MEENKLKENLNSKNINESVSTNIMETDHMSKMTQNTTTESDIFNWLYNSISEYILHFIKYIYLFCPNTLFIPILILIAFIIFTIIWGGRTFKLNIVAFYIFNIIFLFYLFLFFIYSKNSIFGYFLFKTCYISPIWSFTLSFGIDNFSIFFIILTAFLFPIAILIN